MWILRFWPGTWNPLTYPSWLVGWYWRSKSLQLHIEKIFKIEKNAKFMTHDMVLIQNTWEPLNDKCIQ